MNLFKKILVANRGEIAIRVMRACRELGIRSVAVYSEADRDSLFTKYADESYFLGPAEVSQSYLNIGKIMEVAGKAGVDAIHPGYGFLSENPKFAAACESAGIAFIGPQSIVMEMLGNKINAKFIVKKCGVNIIPTSEGAIQNPPDAIKAASLIGYPVILKAAGGGGGRGMYIVEEENQMTRMFELAQSTAQSTFGNNEIFIEKFIAGPKHIEFQFMADKFGNVVCFDERECSIQMRHRKLIEESPSPAITEPERDKMVNLIQAMAKQVGYQNTGTAEFLYHNGEFYFIEINTRLQVEHTITEIHTRIDLVKEQILVAAGNPLSFKQSEINHRGWAIECRINAEDPLNNFYPSVGRLKAYRAPGGIGVRIDSGIYSNSLITTDYDSLVSKVIAWGRDRNEALERMKRALYEYVIVGINSNIPFHLAMMNDRDFQDGKYDTTFIQKKLEYLIGETKQIKDKKILLEDKIRDDVDKTTAASNVAFDTSRMDG
ncbi:MAG: acetyl-CoA carboxylase biotin carboxylase subunit [Planctomycetes bacterium]|nr:acetyl-CoA carboxylase biotin carboxylase subunit [Planctomycetota bacterium]